MSRFQPGNTAGKNNGRPLGSNDQTKRARRQITQHLQTLVERRLADALNGDPVAADSVLAFYAATSPTAS